MNADGSGQRQLTNLGGASAWPTPAPNGGKLAFACSCLGRYHVFTIKLDGTQLRQITTDNTVDDWAPEWSPHGNDIVFDRETAAPTTSAGVNEDVYVVHSDGTGLQQLTNDPAQGRSVP